LAKNTEKKSTVLQAGMDKVSPLSKAEQAQIDKVVKILRVCDRSLVLAWTSDNKLVTVGNGVAVGLETCSMLFEAGSTIMTDILSKQLTKELSLGPHRRTVAKTDKPKTTKTDKAK